MNVAPFSIPNVRVEQRKTSSAEDMARKNSGGKFLHIIKLSSGLMFDIDLQETIEKGEMERSFWLKWVVTADNRGEKNNN